MMVSLSEMNPFIQSVILAEMVRGKVACDYFSSFAREVTEIPNLIQGKTKQNFNRTLKMVEHYSNCIDALSGSGYGVNAMLDASENLFSHANKMIYYYEQAMKRILDRHKIDYSSLLVKLVVGKDLIKAAAMMMGYEYNHIGLRVKVMAELTYGPTALPYGLDTDEYPNYKPTTIGHIHHAVCKLNKEIINKLGFKDILYRMEDNDEISRAISIASTNIYQDLTDYETIHIMFEDEHVGCTWEEAHKIAVSRAEEYQQIEEAKKRKEAHDEELKKAKKEYKKTKKSK